MKTTKNVMGTGLLALALSLAAAPAVRAEGGAIADSPFSIGPRATFLNPKGPEAGKWYAGAQTRLHLGPSLAAEGSIDYYHRTLGPDTRLMVYPVQASLLADLIPSASVSPLLLAGGGWYYSRIEGPNGFRNTQNRFGVHAGGGLEAKFNDHLSLDATYRYLWIEDFQSKDQNVLNKDYQDTGSMVTIGLNVYF